MSINYQTAFRDKKSTFLTISAMSKEISYLQEKFNIQSHIFRMSVSVKSSSKTAIYSHKLFDSILSIFNSESIGVGSNYSNFNRFEWVNNNTSMKTVSSRHLPKVLVVLSIPQSF